ncbi:thiol reductase thioredoxin [Rhodococcus sp. EPR-157]|uniref:thioredoxin family protein n=1 Tax=Rhodococcus sp. EPR-157 TaxID=1813677 RepID=UPI0007BAF98E|nr:thioredoxin family protein [Rhodococcus sp. EPR-157]KZF11041.1 thiol reductase thioredoxin [Rhodococcus sp. EPR-157]
MIGITVLLVVLVAATAFGLVYRSRAGKVRVSESAGSPELRALLLAAGAPLDAPVVLHFSADWCGPCAAVRRVVGQVLSDLEGPVDLELDIDANPELARAMNVMSLPTTFVLGAGLVERARISGVPKAEALRSALVNP